MKGACGMHGDKRQPNRNGQINNAQSRNPGVGGSPRRETAHAHMNVSGRRVNPSMQPRRTVNGAAEHPSPNKDAQPRSGQYRSHPSSGVQQNVRPSASGAVKSTPSNGVNTMGAASASTPAQVNDAPLQMRSRSTAPVSAKKKSAGGKLDGLKKLFAVDKKVIEERNIVREKGSIDYVFLIIVLVLIFFGTVMVYSASYAYSMNTYGDSYYIIFRQIMFALAGFFGMGFAAWFRPEWYRKLSVGVYLFCFALLCVVPIIGVSHNGAKRWINLGFTEIQPSEFMKLGLVLLLAWYFDRYYERITDAKHIVRSSFFGVFVPLVITGITCIMVLIEKHLSGTIIMFLIGVIIIYSSGTAIRLLVGLGVAGAGALALVAIFTDYTKRRIDIWLHPELDPQGGGYQTLQGMYAIGSGGLFGKGLGNSYQKQHYVSQPQNDFIYTIVCEELGFIGAIAVVALFILLAWRGFVIAMKAPDTFSSLVVIGIVGKVVLQAMLNIAVVTNTIPNTGISLPFFSYGGSSLVVLMIEMGIVLSISRYSKQQK